MTGAIRLRLVAPSAATGPLATSTTTCCSELGEAKRLPVSHIAAPVFDPEGTVGLALTVVAFHDRLTSQDVSAVAERLLAATRRVARRIWGVTGASDELSLACRRIEGSN